MTQIVIDHNLTAKLAILTQPAELCDATGRVVGRFTPNLDPTKDLLEPQISDEEMELRFQNKGKTYTTAEVLAYLERL